MTCTPGGYLLFSIVTAPTAEIKITRHHPCRSRSCAAETDGEVNSGFVRKIIYLERADVQALKIDFRSDRADCIDPPLHHRTFCGPRAQIFEARDDHAERFGSIAAFSNLCKLRDGRPFRKANNVRHFLCSINLWQLTHPRGARGFHTISTWRRAVEASRLLFAPPGKEEQPGAGSFPPHRLQPLAFDK
jgi:hypothetical protein